MDGVNKTLFIPLYGKAEVSRKDIILKDPTAEKIWEKEQFPIKGKSASKWLAYNMAMRARIFDDWTDEMLRCDKDALVIHIGCGLDSRCRRVTQPYTDWIDCDFPDVISVRRKYYEETQNYRMMCVNASDPSQVSALPASRCAIVILEGISMYLTPDELHSLFLSLQNKYGTLYILMDVYTEFAAKATKYKNPINDVGVTKVYGYDDLPGLLSDLEVKVKTEHPLTPQNLIDELPGSDKAFFKMMFTGKMYSRIYRLYELQKV